MNKTKTINTVRELIDQVCPHFDKVKFKADSDLGFLDLDLLTNHETVKQLEASIDIIKAPFQPPQYQLTIFQPTHKIIQQLCSALAKEPTKVYINEVEVTYDFITRNPQRLATIINNHLVHKPYHNAFHHMEEETFYWGHLRNTDKDVKQSGPTHFYPVNYYDHESKILKKPCSHLEYKIHEKVYCEKFGLSVPSDLLTFNFVEFFEQNAKFFVMPKKHEIARAVVIKDGLDIKTDKGCVKYYDKRNRHIFGRIPLRTTQKYLQVLPALKPIYTDKRKEENQIFTKKMQDAFLRMLR